MSRLSLQTRNTVIEELYSRFHDPKFLEWDPLIVIRAHAGSPDQEYIALMSALFAFGGVKQIIASVRNALSRLGLEPGASARERQVVFWKERDLQKRLEGFRHRIYVDQDLIALTLLYQKSVQVHGSLKEHFLAHHRGDAESVERGLAGLIADYKAWSDALSLKGRHFKHMLNSPEDGSTCKRWLMFLKWMIRADDGIDLGLWSGPGVRADQLLIPLDTHLFKISRTLRLTRKKTANWKTVLEVTRSLKKLDPQDPTRFDFSLCRYGMFDYRKILIEGAS
jgi:uncharacterized protein (TIGR02757 family)